MGTRVILPERFGLACLGVEAEARDRPAIRALRSDCAILPLLGFDDTVILKQLGELYGLAIREEKLEELQAGRKKKFPPNDHNGRNTGWRIRVVVYVCNMYGRARDVDRIMPMWSRVSQVLHS